jgi:DNA invertase Pin-like site-specific DNA recombinase
MRTALYTRVSTQHKGQETANQLLQLRECCQAQNWSIVREYEDHESGGKSERIAFQQMLRDAAARRFDILFFWSLDRLTREGTLATLKYLELLESYGVRWRSLTEPWIDSVGPFRDVIISLLASLAKQDEFGSRNEFVPGSRGRGSMERAAEGPLAGPGHCSNGIGLLNFDARDSLGAKSRRQSA